MTYTWGRRLIAAVLAGFATALIVFFGNSVMLGVGYLGSSTSPTSFNLLFGIASYFELAAVFAFVLILIAGVAGALSRWWTALIAGIVIALLSTMANTLISVMRSGTKFSGELLYDVWQSLGSVSFVFAIALIVLVPTFGRWMFYRIADFKMRPVDPNRIALVRIPASTIADAQAAQGRPAVDSEIADKQWDGYVAALVDAGWRTVEVAPADTQPGSVFVEDTAVLFGRTAIITRPGLESRRTETAATEVALRELGLDIVRIEEPGTLDGGDVLKVGTTVYAGRSAQTNAEGIRQLRAIVAPLGFTVVAVPLADADHLKSVATALPDGTVIGFSDAVGDPGVFPRFVPVPERQGASVVIVADDHVIMSSAAPASVSLVEDLGYRVTQVDIGEFEKLDATVTGLSVRVR